MALDPAGQFGVHQRREGQRGLAGDIAIVGKVVAGHHRERRDTGTTASGERRGDQAEHADRGARGGQIVLDLRQRGVELAAAFVHAVAAFGDGQRDDADRRVGEPGHHRFRAVLDQQHVANAADHPHLGIRSVVQLHQGEQMTLRGQGVAHGLFLGAGADAADAPVQPFTGIHQGIGISRLMGTMKTANADMGDAGADRFQGIAGALDVGRQALQILFVQLHWMSRG